jgi:hypothetical protein
VCFGAVGSFFFNTFKKNAYFIKSFMQKKEPTAPTFLWYKNRSLEFNTSLKAFYLYSWSFIFHAKKYCPFMRGEGNETSVSTFSFLFSGIQKGGDMSGKRESKFRAELIKHIKKRYEGAIVTKLDAGHIQGIPDLLILYKDKWAILEVKRSKNESHRPNQDYYIDMFGEWSYASFVYPENEEEVLNELERALES